MSIKKKTKGTKKSKGAVTAKSRGNTNSIIKTPLLPVMLLTSPTWNIRDAGNKYKVRISAPGMHKKDIKIKVDGNRLTIMSKLESRKAADKENYVVREYSLDTWSKSIELPERINSKKKKLQYKDGILKLDLPKEQPFDPKKIGKIAGLKEKKK